MQNRRLRCPGSKTHRGRRKHRPTTELFPSSRSPQNTPKSELPTGRFLYTKEAKDAKNEMKFQAVLGREVQKIKAIGTRTSALRRPMRSPLAPHQSILLRSQSIYSVCSASSVVNPTAWLRHKNQTEAPNCLFSCHFVCFVGQSNCNVVEFAMTGVELRLRPVRVPPARRINP
jgi:hypothetical protein